MTTATDQPEHRGIPRMRVIGLGDGGSRAVDRMVAQWAEVPTATVVNTSEAGLAASQAPVRLQIGASLTRGLGTGGETQLGRLAAEADRDLLRNVVTNMDLVFLVVALGGGTGTGAAPVLAATAREEGALTLSFAALPFDFEGETRRARAAKGLERLREESDAVVVVPNQRLFEHLKEGTSAAAAFEEADGVLAAAIRGVWNALALQGLIKLDFAALRNLIRNSAGTHLFGYGEGTGPDRANAAAAAALGAPLLEHGAAVERARALLVSIIGASDLALAEIETAMKTVSGSAPADAHVLMGAAVHPDWTDRVSVTVIACEDWQPAARAAAAGARSNGAHQEKGKAGPGKWTQSKLVLAPTGRGRFANVEPTIFEGEDLDIPTFIRRGMPI